jgi:imidazolonepropionase-like amidohydrolase
MIQNIHPSGKTEYDDSVKHLPMNGRYVIPGLWDMHVHIAWSPDVDSIVLPHFIRHGITGIRDMGGDLALLQEMKKYSHSVNGPMITGAGPFLDGTPALHPEFSIEVSESSDISKLLDSLVVNGSDFFKVYSLLGEKELDEIISYAEEKNMKVVGHLSERIDPMNSIKQGIDCIEHLNRLEETWMEDPGQFDSIVNQMEIMNTALCPTLVIYKKKSLMSNSLRDANLDNTIPSLLDSEWASAMQRVIADEKEDLQGTAKRRRFELQKEVVKKFKDSKVPILAGSDFAGMPFVYPGFGLHEELEVLVEAGFSNEEVLRMATLQAAIYLGLSEKAGSIDQGKTADLVLLHANPLEDIRSTRQIYMVLRNGKIVYQEDHEAD